VDADKAAGRFRNLFLEEHQPLLWISRPERNPTKISVVADLNPSITFIPGCGKPYYPDAVPFFTGLPAQGHISGEVFIRVQRRV
jgi:hypothetical protein